MSALSDFIHACLPASWQIDDEQLFAIHDTQGAIAWSLDDLAINGNTLQATFHHQSLQLQLQMQRLPQVHALTCQITLFNSGAPLTLTRIEPLLLRWHSTEMPVHVTSLAGGTNEHHYPPAAFQEHSVRADDQAFLWIENGYDGRSSNFHVPIMSVQNGDSAVSGGLAWSGLWWMYGSGQETGQRAFSCHIPIQRLQLEPNEQLALPSAHYVFSQGGSAAASNAMRRYIREELAAQTPTPHTAQPVYNHWFGIGPDINAAVFKQQCDQAKQYGISYVVLDAGWYGGCSETNFSSGVGNWERIDTEKFPNGVEEVADYARARDLKFGLWFEVERAHKTSDWATQHPDWFFDIGAEYLHLDMSNAAAVDACIELVSQAVQRYQCQWLKLDYNIGPKAYWQQADPSGKIQFAYMRGLYRFFRSLRERHPNVLLENCASGGRRIDLGTIAETHIQNLTDQTSSAAICRYMMHGAQRFLPANICPIGLPFGDKESHGVADEDFSAFHVLSRFSGLPTLYGDIASNGPRTQKILQDYLALHRAYADVFDGDFYRLTPQAVTDSDHEAVIHLDPNAQRGLLLIMSGLQTAIHPWFMDLRHIPNANKLTLHTPSGIDQTDELQLAGKNLLALQSQALTAMPANSAYVYVLQ